MRTRWLSLGLALGLSSISGCRGERVSTKAASAPLVSAPASASQRPSVPPTPSAAASASEPPVSSTAAASSPAAPPSAPLSATDDEPALLAPDGTPLPQTEERPSVTNPRFERRMQRVAEAILTGDVERGRAAFFPLVAYAQVKDVQKPERDYRFRLMANFERDVREYHAALGRDAERAQLVAVEVPEASAQWMKPGKEGNRVGYYRVLRSKLRFKLPSGAERTFELTSMISWRGEWYVVHLHGFK